MATTRIPLVKPVRCRRCKGTGNVECRRQHLGVPGLCFTCDGTGRVEGDRDTLRERREATERWVRDWDAACAWFRTRDPLVKRGFEALQAEEPARARRAVEAIAAGHPRVEAALLEYLETWRAAKLAEDRARRAAKAAVRVA